MQKVPCQFKEDYEPTEETGSLKCYRLIAITVVFLFSLAVYVNTLDNGLVRDDRLVVLENIWITDIRYIPQILTSAVLDFEDNGGQSNQYRPAYHLYVMVGYALSGKAAWGYHLVNIVFHAFSSILVFLIIFELLATTRPTRGSPEGASEQNSGPLVLFSGFAALVFALHPINTESVAWISAVSELSLAFFYLLSFYLFIRSAKMGEIRYVGSVIFFFVSACSKETAVTLPALLIAYELVVAQRGFFTMVKRLVPFGAAGLVYLALRFWTLSGVIPIKAGHVADLSSFQLLLNVPPLVVKYIGKLILPISLNFDYVFDPVYTLIEPRAFLSAIITVAVIIIIWRLWRRAPRLSFALLFIFIPLLPALYIPALGLNTFTERYLYIPSVGFALLVALLVNKGIEFSGAKGYSLKIAPVAALVSLGVVIVAFYSYGTVARGALWKDAYTLWGDTVEKSPRSRIARNNYAIELSKKGAFDEALFHLEEAARIDPDSTLTYNNLGVLYARKGMLKEAVGAFERSLELAPFNSDAQKNLNKALGLLKEDEKRNFK